MGVKPCASGSPACRSRYAGRPVTPSFCPWNSPSGRDREADSAAVRVLCAGLSTKCRVPRGPDVGTGVVSVAVGVAVAVGGAVAVAVAVGDAEGHMPRALLVAATISSIVMSPLLSASPAVQLETGSASNATLTMITSSLTVTAPSPLQSPTQAAAAPAGAMTYHTDSVSKGRRMFHRRIFRIPQYAIRVGIPQFGRADDGKDRARGSPVHAGT